MTNKKETQTEKPGSKSNTHSKDGDMKSGNSKNSGNKSSDKK